IGCRYCMAACPYGARSFNFGDPRKKDKEGKERIETDENGKFLTDYPTRTKGVVEKCTFCTERIRAAGKDEEVIPACVEVANAAAKEAGEDEDVMTFGKLTDAKIKSILETKRTICRRVALGTGPNVYYVADGLKIG
ncbi:MAG: 4Fe-4S dicluster domain-containing protein, partial [Candidatus Nealsonbacteria bacterium]|nr:4Fe-4S dicluster domain-containing protein [Candidatus Nealsonbacteria bacterium]